MPNTDINRPHSTGAIDRLTLTAAEVRGADSSIRGMCCGCVPGCCGCLEAEPNQITYCLSPGDPAPTCFAGE